MLLIREFDVLVHEMWRLWARFLPQVGTWLALGWLLQTASNMASAMMGAAWGPLAIIVFVLGVTARVVSVILAILSLEPGLPTTRGLRAGSEAPNPSLPTTVTRTERPLEVALLTVGPVLGVYAVWGVVDEMIREGFLWNTVFRRFGNDEWSIGVSAEWLPTYLAVGVAALLLRTLWGRLVRDRTSAWWRVPLLFLEGLWVFATFFIVLIALREVRIWLLGVNIWRQGQHARHRFLEWLPEMSLPFNLTLPEAVARFSHWLVEVFVPGVWLGIALPLVWLALVAIVFGWREFRVRDLVPERLRSRRRRPLPGAAPQPTSFSRAVQFLTEDVRMKYLPLGHAFRLIWRSGPFLLGAFLMLAALLAAGRSASAALLSVTFAAGTQSDMFLAFNAIDFVVETVFTSLALCLYAATFDRGLADTIGASSAEFEAPEDVILDEEGHDVERERVEVLRHHDEH
ncbi:hypothetical protein [Tessaracoccus antarcticus]|uniref:Uncharacterized protein n=1 Tax=Tessaracoccus antarcticus TaxID=2479848 RepID=A0A3M0GGK5_9ACTN|nr:hypothetical protein [Tessaracoccus antarcticus]RMB61842.1 hypothetical protein EAX62_04345 [Tessaracoccus antarcticus]